MLKSLAIGLLSLTATVSTATFAGTTTTPPADEGIEGIICSILPILCQHKSGGGGGGVTAAPEIDPASAGAALTLLAGGLAVLRARRAGKSEKKDS
jgi:hypothetical protein